MKKRFFSAISSRMLLLPFVVLLIHSTESISLDENGYYDIVIAISEKTAQNENENYLENLKNGVQDLSYALWESTRGNCSIKSAAIVLPSHWLTEAGGFVTNQTFRNADIRISHEYQMPQTINPMFCGHAGSHIELPYNFFDDLDEGPYGPTGKALLPLWARYRWGVHEEHGFPGDPQFPYFWKKMRLPEENELVLDEWKVTNCANSEYKGRMENLDEEECGVPDSNDTFHMYPPEVDCRFKLDGNQTAKSSLMSFTFIPSLVHFCDADTHDKRPPTRHNLFCQFLSVWEVIRSTRDWAALNRQSSTSNVRALVEFTILKPTSKPLLYILGDGVNKNKPPDNVISAVSLGLTKILNQTENWNVVVGAGVYPGVDKKDSYDHVYPWNLTWLQIEKFISSFESGFASNKTGFRNYPAAIQDIGNDIRMRKHEPGAIILIIKFGNESVSEVPPHESEVLGTILEQNIKIFALEGIESGGITPLKSITELSGGLHFEIGEEGAENGRNIDSVINAIDEILKQGSIPKSRYRVAHKELILEDATNQTRPIRVDYGNVKKFLIYLHQFSETYKITDPKITKAPDSIIPLPTFNVTTVWGKVGSLTSYLVEVEERVEQPTDWEYFFSCGLDKCKGFLVVIVEVDDEIPTSPSPGGDIEVSVFTSIEDTSIADLNVESTTTLKGTFFAIYARVEKDGHPIHSPDLVVQAHLQFFETSTAGGRSSFLLTLEDDGKGNPDMTSHDGIFSGNFIPPSYPNHDNGVWQVFISVTHRPPPSSNEGKKISRSRRASPMPMDQHLIRCGSDYRGCWNERVEEPFVKYVDLRRRWEFKNSEIQFLRNAPTRIIDLRITPVVNSNKNEFELAWTEPTMLTEYGPGAAKNNSIYYTDDFNKIIDGPLTSLWQVSGVGDPSRPGTTRTHNHTIDAESKLYFVMQAGGEAASPPAVLSNVIFIHVTDPFVEVTTTTSTTTTPPPPSTTTRLTTKDPITTNVPTLTPTTVSTTTTERTTSKPSTTGRTTTSTTTKKPTTIRFETTTLQISYWYQTTGAAVIFSIFGVLMVAIFVGGVTYYKISNH